MTLSKIELWHELARPEPDAKAFNIQLGCHLEEVGEMLEALCATDVPTQRLSEALLLILKILSDGLKSGQYSFDIGEPVELLDSLADQVVTAIGVGHCAGMQTAEACERVNDSNWSKFVDGEPVFNEAGKVAKGPQYREPDLEGLY